jgi:NhaP-type Na+/H+ or K+/H+ antiporter
MRTDEMQLIWAMLVGSAIGLLLGVIAVKLLQYFEFHG